jgi:hypothetical protein
MPNETLSDSENLWKRIGLEELRKSLTVLQELSQRFQDNLKALPECDECAKVMLIEQIQTSGDRLGAETVTLVALAGTLKKAVQVTETMQAELVKNGPDPCCCPTEKCCCHH